MKPQERIVEIDGPGGPLQATALIVPGAAQAVVLIPGSGPVDRDGNGAAVGLRSDTYRLLAGALAGAGITTLRVDKRGLFGSARAIADANNVTLGAYASDARDWIVAATDHAPQVWLAGHSEGGLVALAAAHDRPAGLAGLILLAVPGQPLGPILQRQLASQPAFAAHAAAIGTAIATLKDGGRVDPSTLPGALRPVFPVAIQPFLSDLFAFDPAAAMRAWTGPALVVQGTADLQVRTEDADLLCAAGGRAERLILPGMTHLLKADVPAAPLATYTDPSLPLMPDLARAIADFIAANGQRVDPA